MVFDTPQPTLRRRWPSPQLTWAKEQSTPASTPPLPRGCRCLSQLEGLHNWHIVSGMPRSRGGGPAGESGHGGPIVRQAAPAGEGRGADVQLTRHAPEPRRRGKVSAACNPSCRQTQIFAPRSTMSSNSTPLLSSIRSISSVLSAIGRVEVSSVSSFCRGGW